MKTLYVMRHAKASWDFPDLPDVERPIVEKGIYNTKLIVAELNNKKTTPDLIISSHAKRAIETAKIIATGINYPIEKIETNKHIYMADKDDIFNIIFGVKNSLDAIMIIGHNPTLTQFANLFLDEKINILPTSGVISICFETGDWEGIINAPNKINFTLFPRLLN